MRFLNHNDAIPRRRVPAVSYDIIQSSSLLVLDKRYVDTMYLFHKCLRRLKYPIIRLSTRLSLDTPSVLERTVHPLYSGLPGLPIKSPISLKNFTHVWTNESSISILTKSQVHTRIGKASCLASKLRQGTVSPSKPRKVNRANKTLSTQQRGV